MIKNKSMLVLLLAGLMVVSCAGQHAGVGVRTASRPDPTTLKYPDLKVQTPEYTELQLDNGMKGFFIEDHEIPVVNLLILFKTYYPDKEKLGRNEMARWVMRNGGSAAWPSDKLNDELEFLAARIEFYGGPLYTTASLNCMKKDLPHVMDIFADIIMNPAFPAEKIEMKRKTMIEDIRRQNDQPRDVARREYRKIIYKGHPFGWSDTEESCGNITRDDLVEFHSEYFHPDNTIIGVSGDVTEAEIKGLLTEKFMGWKKGGVEVEKLPPDNIKEDSGIYYAYKPDMNQAYIMMGHLGITADNPDRCALNIMNYILGGGSFASWITEEVREKKGLAYSAGSYMNPGTFVRGTFTAYAQTKAEEYSRTIALIKQQIDRMKNEGPTEEEFEKAVDSYINSQVFDYESKEAIVRRLINLEFQGRPLDTPERDMETYSKLKIEDIKRVAAKYLEPDKLTTLIVGDEKNFGTPLKDMGDVKRIELK